MSFGWLCDFLDCYMICQCPLEKSVVVSVYLFHLVCAHATSTQGQHTFSCGGICYVQSHFLALKQQQRSWQELCWGFCTSSILNLKPLISFSSSTCSLLPFESYPICIDSCTKTREFMYIRLLKNGVDSRLHVYSPIFPHISLPQPLVYVCQKTRPFVLSIKVNLTLFNPFGELALRTLQRHQASAVSLASDNGA